MQQIRWRKWNLNDFCVFYTKQHSFSLLTSDKKELNQLFEQLIEENKNQKIKKIDTTLLPGFEQKQFLELKNSLDIKQNNEPSLVNMLHKLENGKLILPAPLIQIKNNEMILIDGSHRSAFAKIMKVCIKAQILKPSNTLNEIKTKLSRYNLIKKFVDLEKNKSNI